MGGTRLFVGLRGIIKNDFQLDERDGGLFMFLNQRRNRIKLLYWDTDGIAIWMKRLERGCFQSPTNEPQPARCLKDDPGTSLAL